MRRLPIWLLLLACTLSAPSRAQDGAPTDALSLSEYIQTLDDLLARARRLSENPQAASAIRDALPDSWHVHDSENDFHIPANTLRRQIGAWESSQSDAKMQQIVLELETLRSDAEDYAKTELPGPNRRRLLDKILARREFRNVHGPTWRDRLKQRFIEWLLKVFGKAISASAFPAVGDVVVYGLIAIAVLVLAFWMYRSLGQSAHLETIMPVAMPVSAKEWPIWLTEARAAAARGEWREAVHLAYWSGISFLEAQGAWRPDAARTPREYLRLLPAASLQRPALGSLTQQLEKVWYGMQPADSVSFQQALAELEKLGCPSK
jgi:Domain of unknown function (DUF4129)